MNRSLLNLIGRAGLTVVLVVLCAALAMGQDNDDCYGCHDDDELTKQRNGREISLHVTPGHFDRSVHADMDCIDCHQDLDGVDDFPHEDDLADVDCGMCHDEIAEIYSASFHGKAVAAGKDLAPQCWDCHGKHDILPPTEEDSPVARFNIPKMCATCHKEGTEVTQKHDIHADSVFSHYSQSIHGIGLFRQGLMVTAVCSDCHTAHSVLPHTDPASSIHRDNVAGTCQTCHGRIQQVHRKVIQGELWEMEPDRVPACVDCHRPHEIRSKFYGEGIANQECLECHAGMVDSTSETGPHAAAPVDSLELQGSIHRSVTCAQCHTGVDPRLARPCATVILRVDCSICHSETVSMYSESTHGQLSDRGDPSAPVCQDCHGIHGTRERRDPESPTYPTNVPELCGRCHKEGSKAAVRYTGEQHDILQNYVMSIHGKGLLESGLVVTAMCTDCHTAHHVLPSSDTTSSVFHDNIPQTCAKCHKGIYEQFSGSVHDDQDYEGEEALPNCDDCHQAHTVQRTDLEGFKFQIIEQCGRCHEDVTGTYFETLHGKVSKLGSNSAAKCHDCHGAHGILPVDDPGSSLSHQNIVATCAKCHEGSHRQFAGYLTHATHHDRDKYPILFYTFWFMASLLTGTLVLAGAHTLLWLPRSFKAMRERRRRHKKEAALGGQVYQRFLPHQRRLHILVVISFLGLALTGMTIKFSYMTWAQWLSEAMGGFETAAYVHRLCAVITFFYFFTHVYFVVRDKRRCKRSWKDQLLGAESILFNKNDLTEAAATIKWFVGAGPRPQYGHWTYWEKFDYFAVFWGVAVIGSTGLMLWFPEFFTLFLPGWFINVATIIHSDEALLAVAFIFTVHFFNTHFRPDRFPMDTVIFTGRMTLDELKEDRPKEYAQLLKTRQLKKHLVSPMPKPAVRAMRAFGATALVIGLGIIMLIVYAELFGYR